MTPYRFSLIMAVSVTLMFTVARVIEISFGHQPSGAMTAAFSASVTMTLGLIAAGHFKNGVSNGH